MVHGLKMAFSRQGEATETDEKMNVSLQHFYLLLDLCGEPLALTRSAGEPQVHYLYGSKKGVVRKLAATFDSEAQLLSYVNWAILKTNRDGTAKFEQGSALAGYERWEHSPTPLTNEPPEEVFHNPSPSML